MSGNIHYPAVDPRPGTTFMTPAGNPASLVNNSANSIIFYILTNLLEIHSRNLCFKIIGSCKL